VGAYQLRHHKWRGNPKSAQRLYILKQKFVPKAFKANSGIEPFGRSCAPEQYLGTSEPKLNVVLRRAALKSDHFRRTQEHQNL
jgi:hypothetical protein